MSLNTAFFRCRFRHTDIAAKTADTATLPAAAFGLVPVRAASA